MKTQINNALYEYSPDINYGNFDDEHRTMEILRPDTTDILPLFLWVNCGGFRQSDRDTDVKDSVIKVNFAENNFVAADITVTVQGDKPNRYDSFPQNVYDVLEGLAHLYAHAEIYNIDVSNVFIGGGSAGAMLAVIAAWNANIDFPFNKKVPSIKAVVSICGAASSNYGDVNRRPLSPDLEKFASARTRVDADCSPLFIAHGAEDEIVPFIEALEFAKICERFYIKHKLHRVDGAGHALHWEQWGAAALEFLDDCRKKD